MEGKKKRKKKPSILQDIYIDHQKTRLIKISHILLRACGCSYTDGRASAHSVMGRRINLSWWIH